MRRAVMPLTAEAEEARKRCGMAVKKKKHSGWRKDACFLKKKTKFRVSLERIEPKRC